MEPTQASFTYSTPQKVLEPKEVLSQPFVIYQYYINSTVDTVTVVDRNNLAITYRPESGGFHGANLFIIRKVYSFRNRDSMINVINNIGTYFNTYNSDNKELEIVRSTLLKLCEVDSKAVTTDVCIEYVFSHADLFEHEKLYCPSTDTLICRGVYTSNHIHPFSHEGRAYSEYQNFVDSRKVSGVFIEVVDNESSVGARFMYIAKQVVELPVHKDPQRPSGVYFTLATNNRLNQTHLHPEFIDFTVAEEKIGLYKTKEEASSGGNPELLVKQQHLALSRELEDAKSSNSKLREAFKTEEVQRDSKLSQLKHDHDLASQRANIQLAEIQQQLEASKRSNTMLNEQLAARAAVRTDYYENKSSERKDNSETIKSGLLIITSALALYGIFAKSK